MYWPSQPYDMHRLEGEGIVRLRRPDPMGSERAATELWGELLARYGDELAKKHPLRLDERVYVDPGDGGDGFPQMHVRRKRGIGWLLTGKMTGELFDEMVRCGLAADGGLHGAHGWYAFDERVLAAYMTTLVNEVIGERPVETVTDDRRHFRRFTVNSVEALVEDLLQPQPPPGQATDDEMMQVMELAIETVYPAGIDEIPLDLVLQVRGVSAGPRAEFKAAMAAMVDEIRRINEESPGDPIHANDLEGLRVKHIDKPLSELRSALKHLVGDTVSSSLTLKSLLGAGTVGTALGALVGVAAAPVAVVGLALGGYKLYRTTKATRDKLRASPLVWLLDVEKTFAKHRAG